MASDAPPPANKLEGNLIANLSEVSSNTFDYVVVGKTHIRATGVAI